MMTNALLRQIRIDLITGEPNTIIEWFNDLWSKLSIIETDVHHKDGGELIYYQTINEHKRMVFFQDDNNGIFWCNNEHWQQLDLDYSIYYEDSQIIMKLLVENALNINDSTSAITIAFPERIFDLPFHNINYLLNNI